MTPSALVYLALVLAAALAPQDDDRAVLERALADTSRALDVLIAVQSRWDEDPDGFAQLLLLATEAPEDAALERAARAAELSSDVARLEGELGALEARTAGRPLDPGPPAAAAEPAQPAEIAEIAGADEPAAPVEPPDRQPLVLPDPGTMRLFREVIRVRAGLDREVRRALERLELAAAAPAAHEGAGRPPAVSTEPPREPAPRFLGGLGGLVEGLLVFVALALALNGVLALLMLRSSRRAGRTAPPERQARDELRRPRAERPPPVETVRPPPRPARTRRGLRRRIADLVGMEEDGLLSRAELERRLVVLVAEAKRSARRLPPLPAASRPDPVTGPVPEPLDAGAGPGGTQEHAAEIEVLERRIAKLRRALGAAEGAAAGPESPGRASSYREVQGLDPEDVRAATKRRILRGIYEENRDLRRS